MWSNPEPYLDARPANLRGWEWYWLRDRPRAVYAVTFPPTGDRLASGGEDDTVKLWDLPIATAHSKPPTQR